MQDIRAIAQQSAAASEKVSAASDSQITAIEEVNQAAAELQSLSDTLNRELQQFQLEITDANR